VLGELPGLGSSKQKEALSELAPQADALAAELERALPGLKGRARCHAGALLLRLQRRSGRDAFLEALADEDPAVSRAALDVLDGSDFIPEGSGWAGLRSFHVKVPLSCAEIFAAISPLLTRPALPSVNTALSFCLKHDVAASRPLTRGLLETGTGSQRLQVASWYLRNGRDDGALDVLATLLAAAPQGKEPSWSDLKGSWRALVEFCRSASKQAVMRGAHLAIRVVADALDAPDWKERFYYGYIDAGRAAEVIAAAMPEGAESALRRLVLVLLADRALLRDAAEAAKASAAAGVTDGLLTALIEALDDQTLTEEEVGAILSAMTACGEDARPHIEAALARADPGDGMWLNWHLQGGSLRAFADLLVDAGAADPIGDAALADVTLNSFVHFALLSAGGQRLAVVSLKGDERPPPHHKMFRDLLAIARPIVEVERLVQRHDGIDRREPVPRTPGSAYRVTTCIVQFLHDGQEYSFRTYPRDGWFDVDSVVVGFNAFMAQIGRNDRCHRFHGIDDVAFFAVAPEATFGPLAERLLIPLVRDADEARRRRLDTWRQAISSERDDFDHDDQ
jgi:hypothetical protein